MRGFFSFLFLKLRPPPGLFRGSVGVCLSCVLQRAESQRNDHTVHDCSSRQAIAPACPPKNAGCSAWQPATHRILFVDTLSCMLRQLHVLGVFLAGSQHRSLSIARTPANPRHQPQFAMFPTGLSGRQGPETVVRPTPARPKKHPKSSNSSSFPTSRVVRRPNGAVCRRQYAACVVSV